MAAWVKYIGTAFELWLIHEQVGNEAQQSNGGLPDHEKWKSGKAYRAEVEAEKMNHIQTPTLSHTANMIYRC